MLSEQIKQKIDEVVTYVGNTTTDWLRVKREILNILPAKDRSLFSKRHFSTKKQVPNDFDREVMDYWKERTGITLFFDPSHLHDETSWIYKPRGHGLQGFNQKRTTNKV